MLSRTRVQIAIVSKDIRAEVEKEKNRAKLLEYLKSAGAWALDVATKIGTGLATEALEIALGL